MTDRAVLPDILIKFPVRSKAIWFRHVWDGRKQHVAAIVAGKTPHQGNKRLSLWVFWTQRNPFGEMVLYTKLMKAVSVDRVMTLAEYYATKLKPMIADE